MHGGCGAYREADWKPSASGHTLCLQGQEPGQSLGKPRGRAGSDPGGVGAALFCGEGGLVLGTETTFERVSGHRSPALVAHNCLPHARPCPLPGLEFQLLETDQGPPRPPLTKELACGIFKAPCCSHVLPASVRFFHQLPWPPGSGRGQRAQQMGKPGTCGPAGAST